MTERELLRLILVNQAYVLSALATIGSRVSIGASETQSMLAHAKVTMDLVEKDEEENPEARWVGKTKVCPHCGVEFTSGGDTGRRVDAVFCSHEHQIAYNSRKRSMKESGNG